MSASEESAGKSKGKFRRVRTGCLTCRARKVKCDETPGICGQCSDLKFECRWSDGTNRGATGDLALPVLHSRNPPCLRCREARSKCCRTRPTCQRCLLNGLPCEYQMSGKRKLSTAAKSWFDRHDPTAISPSHGAIDPLPTAELSSKDALPELRQPTRSISASQTTHPMDSASPPASSQIDRLRCERLMAAFFHRVHEYQANAFFHYEATMDAMRNGKISRTLLLSIWAVSARFSDPPESAELAAKWAEEAGHCVTSSREISRENVIAALLLAKYSQHAGIYSQTHLWCAVANRQALSLGLHRETHAPGTQSWIEAEGDRRLYVACYALERHISNGAPESVYCPAHRLNIRLPCENVNYRMGIQTETPSALFEGDETHVPIQSHNSVGLMGFYVRLVGIRFMLKQWLHTVQGDQQTSFALGSAPWDAGSTFARCLAKLATWKNSLPSRLRLNREIILARQHSPELGPLVMLYLWWNMCHLELCRVAIPGYPESLSPALLALAPDGWQEGTRRTCFVHAKAISSILSLLHETLPQGLVIYDHTLAHLVYSSIRMQIDEVDMRQTDEKTRAEMRSTFQVMLNFVGRTSTLFRSGRLLRKETNRLIGRHGLGVPTETNILESRPETPPQMWFRNQKALDDVAGSASTDLLNPSEADVFDQLLAGIFPEDENFGSFFSWDQGMADFGSWPQHGQIQANDGAMFQPNISFLPDVNQPISPFRTTQSGDVFAWQAQPSHWQPSPTDSLLPNFAAHDATIVSGGQPGANGAVSLDAWLNPPANFRR